MSRGEKLFAETSKPPMEASTFWALRDEGSMEVAIIAATASRYREVFMLSRLVFVMQADRQCPPAVDYLLDDEERDDMELLPRDGAEKLLDGRDTLPRDIDELREERDTLLREMEEFPVLYELLDGVE